jgi:hypothetical protein
LDGQVVYKGITNDPYWREREHWEDGKRFAQLVVYGDPKPRWRARRDERAALGSYYRRYGRQPRYNRRWGG